MQKVVFVAYEARRDAVELALRAQPDFLAHDVSSDLMMVGSLGADVAVDSDMLVVSLGGDGTFLRAARTAHTAGAHVMGVNLGRVGFLVPVEPSDLLQEVLRFFGGSSVIENRAALEVATSTGAATEVAINEVVLERAQPGHMVRVRLFIENEEFLTYSADGVLVATPTGSTGYNFSAGGPVLAPSLQTVVVTPVAPHFTIDRSLVVDGSCEIRMEVLDRPAIVVADGLTVTTLNPGESLQIHQHARPVKVALPSNAGFGARLRHSLREGHA